MAVSVARRAVNSATELATRDSTTDEEQHPVSEIAEFFNGRSVFITGATGFVGSVLLETLLRCCPGLKKAYILLRRKAGMDLETRKEQITMKKIFCKLKSSNPDVFKKMEIVEGDVAQENLGISADVMEYLVENVSVVFHCAAIVNFGKPLRYVIIQNAVGTENVANFCRRLRNLTVLVHTSTAYSQSNKSEVPESVPVLQVPASQLMDAAKKEDDERLASLAEKCVPPWPNTYTFSKAVAERYLADNASDLPVAIVRPSVIISCWKGILPGYTEEGAGLTDVSVGIGKGFIRVLFCDPNKIIDIIPVDVVSNTLITASWYIGTKRTDDMLVVNCTSGRMSPTTWNYFIGTLYRMQELYPLPKMYQKPFLVMRKHKVTYWASALANHYAPALCIDAVLLLTRKKPKLTKLYLYYDLCLSYLRVFLTTEWRFHCDNYKTLISSQNGQDQELFPINIRSFSINDIAKSLRSGAPFYEWEKDSRKISERMPIAYKRYLLTTTIKWMSITWSLVVVGVVVSKTLLHSAIF